MMAKRKNIDEMMQMIYAYLNGKMTYIEFYLDFPYELSQRYDKMIKEDEVMAEEIYYLIEERCINKYLDAPEEDFIDALEYAYNELYDLYHGNYDIL